MNAERAARVCLVALGGLYLLGGGSAVSGFFQMRAGPGDLRDWFSSNGMPPIRFLITGAVYCVVGVTCMSAAVLLRRDNSKGRLFAMAAIVLVTLDMLADLYRKRSIGFNLDGLVETTLTLALLLVTAVYLAQRRRPPE